MTHEDFDAFVTLWESAGEFWRQSPSDEMFRRYWDALRDLTWVQVRTGFRFALLLDEEFPTVARIFALAEMTVEQYQRIVAQRRAAEGLTIERAFRDPEWRRCQRQLVEEISRVIAEIGQPPREDETPVAA